MSKYVNDVTKLKETSKFQLNYVVWEKGLGHISIGITALKGDGIRELIFLVGLYTTSQVALEKFKYITRGEKVKEITFDISKDQMTAVLRKINWDRRLKNAQSLFNSRQPEIIEQLPNGKQSTPGGPKYNLFYNNCKDYGLRILEEAGIDVRSLKNFLINIPVLSGSGDPLELANRSSFIGCLNIK